MPETFSPLLDGRTIITIGLLLDIAGAAILAFGLFVTDDQAIELGGTRWMSEDRDENLKIPSIADRIRQSNRAKFGLILLTIGFSLQIVGTWVP